MSGPGAPADLLSIRDLHVRYGEVLGLRGVTLTVRAGEAVGVTGANGAGKSTLLRAVSGLVKPVAGEIVFERRAITALPPQQMARLGISHVPEGRRLFPDLTAAENLRLGALAVGRRGDVAEVLEILPTLRPLFQRAAGSLSGGEQQMVSIGRALMAEPRLLMVDEISLGLAPKTTEMLYDSLKYLNRAKGLSMIIVDENVRLLAGLVARMHVLNAGEVALELTPDQLDDLQALLNAYLGKG